MVEDREIAEIEDNIIYSMYKLMVYIVQRRKYCLKENKCEGSICM